MENKHFDERQCIVIVGNLLNMLAKCGLFVLLDRTDAAIYKHLKEFFKF